MRYFLIAGEASGDLHASNLMKGLLIQDPQAEFRFMGGDLMERVAGERIVHYRATSYMMLDVLFHLGKIFRTLRRIKSEIRTWKPDVVIPVDYPGFNIRIARFATRLGIKVFYYISPKVWAWKQKRVKKLKKYTGRLFVILPFEVEFFRRFGVETEFFGHPLVDEVDHFRKSFEGENSWKSRQGMDDRPIIALLAGSRRKEIEAMLPSMVQVAAAHPNYRFVVAGAPSIEPAFYDDFIQGTGVEIVHGETYALLESAWAGLITSGTATLEAALFHLPQVVLYRTSWLAYSLGKRLIKTTFISLVNLILGKKLVVEIIQKKLYELADQELSRILQDQNYRAGMEKGYQTLKASLGEPGVSGRIAHRMVELLNTIAK